MSPTDNPTRFFGLGGMQEIGKSTLVIEDDNDIVIIDAGIKFANIFATGIKGMVPDYQYLKQNESKIRGVFITHGHEDHIGGIAYLVRQVQIKAIYGAKIAIEFLKAKFADLKIHENVKFIEINKDDVYKFNTLSVDFWTAQHSIPDAFGIRITSPHGSIMCTGDFRFDYTPIGNYTDFDRLKTIGDQNLTVLFSDSTNAMRPNHSPSEKDILSDIEMHMRSATKKIIITAFASNLTRIKAIMELGIKLNKKIITFGRSMVNGINIGRKIGYIEIPNESFAGKNLNQYEPNELLILTTGSQGEQLAALDRMSNRKHPKVAIESGDLVIFSSSPIPGNRIKIEHLINRLYKLNAIIKENGPDGYLHTSGHAYKEEHEKIFQYTKPKYFFPYHGEYRMCLAHKQTAIECGVKKENVLIPANGQVYEMVNQEVRLTKKTVACDPVYIDGEIISLDNTRIIDERELMRENGFVYVLVPINRVDNSIFGRVKIISRGAFIVKKSQEMVQEIRRLVHSSILFLLKNKTDVSIPQIKQTVKNRLNTFFYKQRRRKPVILSSVIYVDERQDFIQNHKKAKSSKDKQEKAITVNKKTAKNKVKKVANNEAEKQKNTTKKTQIKRKNKQILTNSNNSIDVATSNNSIKNNHIENKNKQVAKQVIKNTNNQKAKNSEKPKLKTRNQTKQTKKNKEDNKPLSTNLQPKNKSKNLIAKNKNKLKEDKKIEE
ncbi:hydrolase [Mesomycoplasma conjunctivae]|uniref:Serine protease, subtilase family act n=1 Tax=Mesomycoplasma conjunctivae (strain ATCC 25834 / NCTC 10147 / HRC/581) TaxID=572263 RepID=C5J795_MESCH|nr:ribonuclease J [Mesomycoplasma conjunctivae]CAT05358.1 Putative serine protease, subtilase family act [Mesomycoplasma conjunctivae]VEU66585.1 hydrolase [Mesomycoplasma conjunctivae]